MKKPKFTALIPHTEHKKILMTVCPACLDFRENRLRALLSAMYGRFSECRLIMADDLDQHNMLRTYPDPEAALFAARKRGNEWLDRYWCRVRDTFNGNLDLIHWQNVRHDPSFCERLEAIKQLFYENEEVRQYFRETAAAHTKITCSRWHQKGIHPEKEKFYKLATDYIMEEYAGLTVIRSWTGWPEVYPGHSLEDPHFFNKRSKNSKIELTLPALIRPVLVEKESSSHAA